MPDYTKAGKNHEFEKGTRVLAMYPETTCFYQGTVIAPPSKVCHRTSPADVRTHLRRLWHSARQHMTT